ncbi:MAG: hypothetical protein NWQ13_03805, partial [Glaciimonas sp.]|nr:hypothetical protein [Glaciimonas sp.]
CRFFKRINEPVQIIKIKELATKASFYRKECDGVFPNQKRYSVYEACIAFEYNIGNNICLGGVLPVF